MFIVTDFYGAGNAELEIQHGKNAVDAAKEVRHLGNANCSYTEY